MSTHTEALQQLVDIIDSAGLLNLSNGVQLGQTVWYVKAFDRLNYAREVLAAPAPDTEAAVDATLGVTAELARVTAERDELAAETSDLSRLVARQADLLTAAVNALKGEPPELVLWSHHDVGELAAAMTAQCGDLRRLVQRSFDARETSNIEHAQFVDAMEGRFKAQWARAEKAEKERDALAGKLADVDTHQLAWEAAVDVRRRERDAAEEQVQLRDRLLATTATKLGEAHKANAALRAALKALFETRADRSQERGQAIAQAEVALADPNLGADYVPTGAIGVALSVQSERHRVELRRVAEAVRDACAMLLPHGADGRAYEVLDLDAIVRGTR